ncbi:ABC transporter substrate-binding protein [Bordetella hinzii]|uniref:ABC transporter substrate-binding protein n=1 Tax=Bordetella hinzii TaxID=103855 RepID=UPI003F1A8E02
MKRRQFLQTAGLYAGLGGLSLPSWANAQTDGLKPGKPYAGTRLSLMLPPASQFRAQEKYLPQFEQATGIKVAYQYVPYGQLLEKITTEAVGGGSAYDMFAYQDSWLAALANYLQPLDSQLKADGVDMKRYPEVYRQACRINDATYGLPVRAHPQLLFYRKDLYGEAGVAPPATWDALLSAAAAVQQRSGVPGVVMDYVKGSGFQNLWLWFNCLWGHGSDVLDADQRPLFNNAAGVAATQAYVDLLLKHRIANPGSSQFNEYDMVNAMAQGNGATMMVWWWTYAVLTGDRSRLKPEQVGFAPMLRVGSPASPTVAIVMPFGIARQSRQAQAAWEFLKWVSSPALEKAIVCDKSDPQTTDIVATQTATYQDEEVNRINHGLHRVALQSLAGARTVPQMAMWPQVGTVLESTISEIVSTGKPVKAALDEAAAQVERSVRRSGGRRRG